MGRQVLLTLTLLLERELRRCKLGRYVVEVVLFYWPIYYCNDFPLEPEERRNSLHANA